MRKMFFLAVVVLVAAMVGCTPNQPGIEVVARSENFTLLATPDPYGAKWVDFGHEGYPTSAHLGYGEVIAYVQCSRDEKPYVLQFSSFEDGSPTEPISPEACLGLDTSVAVEVAVATTNDQWYIPECDIEVDPLFEECDFERTLLDPDYLPADVVVPDGAKIRFWNFKIWGPHKMVLVLGPLE